MDASGRIADALWVLCAVVIPMTGRNGDGRDRGIAASPLGPNAVVGEIVPTEQPEAPAPADAKV